ncbi:hypothetical protein [Phycicoccus sp. SLBN-51]|uniref:hypothetical protein n=1 Tax=Phycicoccus sp. SLBN-51 TaxID=2768447 RepID=UPI001153654A|nr:hypothetical protein [Phycicoccus sp. SLBN-51]TQJ49637.1 hypothetical protein FBY26_1326 [Phycicoccus sp. SLBN-51]
MGKVLSRGIAPLVAAGGLFLGLGFGLPAAQAGAVPAQKVPLTQTNYSCDGSMVDGARTTTFGFVNLVRPASGKLVAAVVLKGAKPNTTFNVRLIQVVPGNSDCLNIDATLTTDEYGNGEVNVQEPVLSGASQVWVALNNQNSFTEFFTMKPQAL